jgi:Prion-inhibition and propagation
MAEAGLVIGGLSLGFQLFGISLDAFSLLETAANFGEDGLTFSCMLKLEEHRLLLWAKRSGLVDNRLDPRFNEALICETLAQLRNLLSDTANLKAKYKLEINSVLHDAHNIPAVQPWGPPLTILDNDDIVKERKNIILRARAAQKASWFPRRLIWAKKDRQGFKDLLEAISQLISKLYDFIGILATEDVQKELKLLELKLIAVTTQLNEIQLFQEGFSASAGPSSTIATVASLRALNLSQGMQPKGITPKLTPLKWKLLTDVLDLSKSAPRTVGKYENENVFIEWKAIPDSRPIEIDRRVENLAVFLQSPKERTFRSLKCLGVLEDSNHSRYCFIYEKPNQFPPTGENIPPRTLLQYLSSSYIPSLTARFRLASQLAYTILHLHTSGWLHKAIRSENILFFPTGTESQRSLENPYLMGYEYARADSIGELSEKASSNPALDIYRHPLAQGPTSSSFTKAFDIYSLGIVLYEIAVWRNFSAVVGKLGISRCSSNEMQKVRERLLDTDSTQGLFQGLEFRVGALYAGVVRFCIGGELEDNNINPDEFVTLFSERVVQTLGKCRA